MELKELYDLKEAKGLLIFTTAEVAVAREILLSINDFHFTRESPPGTQWMERFVGENKEVLRFHLNDEDSHAEDLFKKGFITRIDFFIHNPTHAMYEVVRALLEVGYRVAAPDLYGSNVTDGWEIFEPTSEDRPSEKKPI